MIILKKITAVLLLTVLLAAGCIGCGKAAQIQVQEMPEQSLKEIIQTPQEISSEPVPEEVPEEPVHEHQYTAAVTEPDCTQAGFTEYTCECGDQYTGDAVPATGHTYEDEVIEPTIAADGFTRHTCAVCGDVVEDTVVPMLPDGIEDGSFFNDAAFVGDSITLSMTTHARLTECFGDALFLCRASFSIRAAADHSMDLTYRGGYYTVAEVLQACGAKKVFIQLGMNDIATYTADKSMEYWTTVIGEIRELNPDILIFIQSGTPIYDERGKLNNANMDQYNLDLKALAEELDVFFVDIATPLKYENGFLRYEYCSDQYCHLSLEGAAVWERTLKDYLLEHKGEFA